MFNFYVVLANKDMVTDITGLPRAGAISKPFSFEQNVKKIEEQSDNKGLNGRTV